MLDVNSYDTDGISGIDLSENDGNSEIYEFHDLKHSLHKANDSFFDDFLMDYKNDYEDASDVDS